MSRSLIVSQRHADRTPRRVSRVAAAGWTRLACCVVYAACALTIATGTAAAQRPVAARSLVPQAAPPSSPPPPLAVEIAPEVKAGPLAAGFVGLSLEYRKYDLGAIRDEGTYRFNFTLANIGSAGNLRRAESLF